MKVDNVTFVEVAVKGMTKEEFINAHIKVVWQELKEADRKKKLSEVLIREVGLVDINIRAASCNRQCENNVLFRVIQFRTGITDVIG